MLAHRPSGVWDLGLSCVSDTLLPYNLNCTAVHCTTPPFLLRRVAGKFYNAVPLLIGSNHDEGTPFNFLPQNVSQASVQTYIQEAFGPNATEVLAMVRVLYLLLSRVCCGFVGWGQLRPAVLVIAASPTLSSAYPPSSLLPHVPCSTPSPTIRRLGG